MALHYSARGPRGLGRRWFVTKNGPGEIADNRLPPGPTSPGAGHGEVPPGAGSAGLAPWRDRWHRCGSSRLRDRRGHRGAGSPRKSAIRVLWCEPRDSLADTPRVIKRTTALAYGLLGLFLGGCLGVAGGLARHRGSGSGRRGLGRGLAAVLGGAPRSGYWRRCDGAVPRPSRS